MMITCSQCRWFDPAALSPDYKWGDAACLANWTEFEMQPTDITYPDRPVDLCQSFRLRDDIIGSSTDMSESIDPAPIDDSAKVDSTTFNVLPFDMY